MILDYASYAARNFDLTKKGEVRQRYKFETCQSMNRKKINTTVKGEVRKQLLSKNTKYDLVSALFSIMNYSMQIL